MKVALGIYVALYVVAVAITIADDFKFKNPVWDTASDVLLLPLGLVGIFLYALDVPSPEVRWAWKLVAPAIILGQVASNIAGRHWTLKHTVVERDERWFADIVTPILLLPMFMANFAYAFR